MVPGLCEDTSPSPTPAFLEAWAAAARSGAHPWQDWGLARRQQALHGPPSKRRCSRLQPGAGFLIHNDDEERPVYATEVVRFVNRRADRHGMHSLLQDAPGEGSAG